MSLLCTRNLTLQIGSRLLCDQLNLTVQAGTTWGILGPNGSGKTTLLHSLAGLQAISAGTIQLAQQPLTQLSAQTIAQTVGVLLQDMPLAFPQTVWEYCLAGRYPHLSFLQRETLSDHAIALAALSTLELDKLTSRYIQHLSGGEQRRLAIASLLTQAPKLYLLDEPTNHLDIRHQLLVLNHFRHLVKQHNISVIMSLHDLNLAAQFCEHILLLFPNGEIVAGQREQVLTEHNVSRLYQQPMRLIQANHLQFWLADGIAQTA